MIEQASFDGFRSSILKESRKWLVGRSFETNEREWNDMISLYFIRNTFLHYGGRVFASPKATELRRLAAKPIGLRIDMEYLKLDASFATYSLAVTEKFLESLSIEYGRLCDRAV